MVQSIYQQMQVFSDHLKKPCPLNRFRGMQNSAWEYVMGTVYIYTKMIPIEAAVRSEK